MAATSQAATPISVPKMRKPAMEKSTRKGLFAIYEGPIWPGMCGPVITQIRGRTGRTTPTDQLGGQTPTDQLAR